MLPRRGALPVRLCPRPSAADEVVSDASGNGLYAQPVMQFKYGVPGSIMVPCVGGAQSPILTFNPGVTVPCINGVSPVQSDVPGAQTD